MNDLQWNLWAQALIDCEVDGHWQRLRGPAAEPLPSRGPIFVVTAYNPRGEERELDLNEIAEQELELELEHAGASYWPAVGHSDDGTWVEPGVAVAGLTRAEACGLGHEYGQIGVFELTDREVRVVACRDGEVKRTRRRDV